MPRSPALIGRAAELRRLVELAGSVTADDRRCRFVLIAGEAGIGKTRLVDELCAVVAARVLRGRADEDDPAAFGVWLPVLALVGLPRPGADRSVAVGEQRWEVVDLLASAFAEGDVLILEDLHWADEDSLWVLEQLLDRSSGQALAVIATTRPGSAARVARWHALYRRAEVVALDGLDASEVADLASQLGHPDTDGRALWERTGGNPLFVREQVLSGRITVSRSIEPLLTASIEQLGDDAADLVSLVALAGPATPLPVLAAAAGVGPDDIERRIDAAARADVLRLEDSALRFRHDLLAEAAVRRLGPDARARVHVALADAYAQSAGPEARHAESRHRLLGVPLSEPTTAARGALATAAELRQSGRVADAAALLHLAGDTLADRADVDALVEAEVAVAAADARWALDDYDGARAASRRAVELAALAGDPVVAARAEVAATAHHNPFIPDPAAIERLRALDEQLGGDETVDPALRARLRGRRAILTLTVPDRMAEAVALADQAVASARALGDPDVLVAVLGDRHFAQRTPADYAARAAAAVEILSVATAARRPDLARLGHEWTYVTRSYEGDLAGAIAALDSLELLAAIMPSPLWRYGVAVRRGTVLLLLGDYEGALAMAAASRALGAGVVDDDEVDGLELSMRATAGLLYGRDDHGCGAVFDRLMAAMGDVPVLSIQAMAAVPDLLSGHPAAARRRVAPWVGRLGGALDGPEGLLTLGTLAHVAVAVGWPEMAVELRPLLAPFAGRMPAGGAVGPDLSVDHHLGALALLVDDVAAAVAHAQRAVAFARRMRSPVLEARALALLAAAGGRTGDRAAAASARDAALTIAEPLGMRLAELDGHARRAAGAVPPTRLGPDARRVAVELAGGRWAIRSPFGAGHVADSAGMQQLVQLVAAPGRDVAAIDLVGAARGQPMVISSDLGPALDARAKREYRQRIGELQADIDAAEQDHDGERAVKYRIELDALLDQLRTAVGIGGRDRPQGSGNERARVNATRTIRRAIAAISGEIPELGAHLEVSIRTGYQCAYAPEPAAALTWTVTRA